MGIEKTSMNKTLKFLKRVRWKVVAPLLVAVILVVYLIIALISGLITRTPSGKDNEINTNLCSLNSKKTLEIVANENRENPTVVKDFAFYGESLNLFFDEYQVGTSSANSLEGKTAKLVDLCTGTEIKFENMSGIDNMIDLGKLTPGFYSVYLVKDETSSRVVMNSTLVYNNTFTTVRRDGKCMKVELIADKTMFDPVTPAEGAESVLDNNYLYIKVTEISAEENTEYDIAISVAPALTSEGVSVTGEDVFGNKESEMLWPAAEELKAKLEEAGLKVIITKEANDEEILYYGDGGTLSKAYNLKAKYMIHLDIYDYGGKGVEYSYYSSGKLAKSVFEAIKTQGDFLQDDRYLVSCDAYESDLNQRYYDGTYEIREAGGKILGASEYSVSAQVNSKFAGNNIYGINTIVVMPVEIGVEGEVNSFNANNIAFADAVANGIIEYLKK